MPAAPEPLAFDGVHMLSRRDELLIGLGVMVIGAAILWWIIPNYITTPRRVPIRALSPAFWPKIIAWTIIVCGGVLSARALFAPAPPDAVTDDLSVSRPEGLRLLALGAILLGIYFALPIVGMVWVSMIAFALLVLLSGGKHLAWGMIAAVVLPLLLYFFFTKVAGVAIPQGQIVRLP
ncbi:tripartite tricarboxylate transporter TctB family protein [Roseinatronobacter sp.]|uniref:tripartite tricarboxylate transporter TctB family protein n=1 Tax=Roseinatronobacter sp. TaxID=1945755 RepID=UPI0025EBED6A|nr:tripartite tricarboxylate transporter TctB family protein [Rhodobaca sp.]